MLSFRDQWHFLPPKGSSWAWDVYEIRQEGELFRVYEDDELLATYGELAGAQQFCLQHFAGFWR